MTRQRITLAFLTSIFLFNAALAQENQSAAGSLNDALSVLRSGLDWEGSPSSRSLQPFSNLHYRFPKADTPSNPPATADLGRLEFGGNINNPAINGFPERLNSGGFYRFRRPFDN